MPPSLAHLASPPSSCRTGDTILSTCPVSGEHYNATASSSALGNPYLFTGRDWDGTLGLQYTRVRWYDPVAGRWFSRDPIGYADGANLYEYVAANPLLLSDPMGLWTPIKREGGRRASTCAQEGDTILSLAQMVGLDEEEAQLWLQPFDALPVPGKVYTVPNTLIIDYGANPWYRRSWLLSDLQTASRDMVERQAGAGFLILSFWDVTDADIRSHFADPDIFAHVYIGHGDQGSINKAPVGVAPGEGPPSNLRVHHRLYLLALLACNTFDWNRSRDLTTGQMRSNWEFYVSKYGLFAGFEGDPSWLSSLFSNPLRLSYGGRYD